MSKALATIHSKNGAHNFPQILLGLFYRILSTTSQQILQRLYYLPMKTTSTLSTDSNNCNRCETESQKHYLVFVPTSTLSTAVNTCQHLSTEALVNSNSENDTIPESFGNENHVNKVNGQQHLQQRFNKFTVTALFL